MVGVNVGVLVTDGVNEIVGVLVGVLEGVIEGVSVGVGVIVKHWIHETSYTILRFIIKLVGVSPSPHLIVTENVLSIKLTTTVPTSV